MGILSVGANSSTQYAQKVEPMQEQVKSTPKADAKELGVIVEISKDIPEAKRLSEKIQQRIQNGELGKNATATHRVVGNSANGMVSFYGASVTKEQSEKLQNVIKDLEERGTGALGDSWNTGAYTQLGLKVSQLSYACKKIGLSDEAAEQVTSTYGKRTEEKINKINDMTSFLEKQVKIVREQFYKEHGTPNYRKDAEKIKESLVSNNTGKTSVELNTEANRDVYQMFSTLDVNSKDAFQSDFQKAVESYKNYYAGGEVQIFTGTSEQQAQLVDLMNRFQNFLEA